MAANQIYTIQQLSPDQIDIVKASVPILKESGQDLTKNFYQKMLSTYPEVKPFFNESDQVSLRQPRILAFALLKYAENIENLEPLTAFVQQIVTKHVGLQVKAEHYPIVGTCLLGTMKDMLGELATPEFLQAWATAYGNLAQLLIDAESTCYQHQPWNGFKEFTIKKIQNEASDVKSVYFSPSDGSAIAAPQRGQYVCIRWNLPGQEFEKSREYSLSEFPTENHYRISVRKLDGGKISSYIHEQLRVGDKIKVAPPGGSFTYHENDPSVDMLVYVGGIGITPLVSILEEALSKGRKVKMFNSNRSETHRPFGEWLSQLTAKYPDFNVTDFYSETGSRLQSRDFEFIVPSQKYDVYVLGPRGYMHFVNDELAKRGNDISVYSETFGPTEV
ncbi:Flavohemoprotein [Meyerozyma sp. JA9]|nr:Flavohemoprotein [Meyerozyma sp. JA9]